jgi:hypothetical protein
MERVFRAAQTIRWKESFIKENRNVVFILLLRSHKAIA